MQSEYDKAMQDELDETPETHPDTGRVTPKLIARSIDHSRLTYDGRAYIELPADLDPADAVVVSKAELARMEATNVMLQGVSVADLAAANATIEKLREELVILADTASECDSWESFPDDSLHRAYAAVEAAAKGGAT